jgi:nitrogen fixation NifU-like protein
MDLYREEVMDHYEHPRNQGELTGDDVLSDRDSNASCGDMVQFYVRLRVNAKTRQREIGEVKWKGIGCAITTAAASKLSEYLRGRTLQELRKMSEEEMVKVGVGFEVNPGRIKCLMLPVKVVKKLLGN